MKIKILEKSDISALVAAFAKVGWSKTTLLFQEYLHEQDAHQRCAWVAYKSHAVAGYVTLKWYSEYASFEKLSIPEISDLNVLPQFRNQGIGSVLLDTAEAAAFTKSKVVGLGVGLYADYGNAQKLYAKRGYIPDGRGITYNYQQVPAGDTVRVDDNCLLWLLKSQ